MPQIIYNSYFDNAVDDTGSGSGSGSDTDTDVTVESEDLNHFSKNDIILCEIFNPHMHGFTRESDRSVLGHFLVIGRYSVESIVEDETSIFSITYAINNTISNIRNLLIEHPKFTQHPLIRNYKQIALRNNYIRPEIAQCIMLNGNETVAILKTFWIRIVQRAWKKVFQARCIVRNQRMSIYSLGWRQIYGCWPDNCRTMPSIYGMLGKIV